MGGKCQCCGYGRCNDALAFHHIDPSSKDIGFADTRSNPIKWQEIVTELRKCILVCHVCHSEIHAGIRILPESYAAFDETYSDYNRAFVDEIDTCPVCSGNKYKHQKYCSHACAAKGSRKVDWDNINLLDLLKKHTIAELEEMLGISNAAIYKRRDKILGQI